MQISSDFLGNPILNNGHFSAMSTWDKHWKQNNGYCAYFNTEEGCNRGESCPYIHEKGKKPPCKYYGYDDLTPGGEGSHYISYTAGVPTSRI